MFDERGFASDVNAVAKLWLLFAVIYFPMMTTLPLSIDAEVAATMDYGFIWIAQGRWMTFVLYKYLLPFPVVPYFTVGLFGLCAAGAYVLVLRGCRLPLKTGSLLAFTAFAACPIWSCLIEFPANIASAGFGLLSCGVAAFAIERLLVDSHKLRWAAIVIISATLAIGIYQAFAFVALAAGLAVVFFADDGQKVRGTIAVFALAAVSIVMHLLIQELFVKVSGIQLAYIDAFVRPDLLLADPVGVVGKTATNIIRIYAGARSMFGAMIWAGGILVALAALVTVMRKGFISALILLAILLVPFPLMFLAGGSIPLRTLIAVPVSMWVCAIVVMNSPWKRLQIAGYLLTGILALQSAAAISQYQAERIMAADFDRQTASRIYQRISEVADLSKPQKVDIYGAATREHVYPVVAEGSTAGASFFSWDGGNILRMSLYMQIQGYKNLVQMPADQRKALIPEFEAMPVFPAAGSVRLLNDVVLVKLGQQPGYY